MSALSLSPASLEERQQGLAIRQAGGRLGSCLEEAGNLDDLGERGLAMLLV